MVAPLLPLAAAAEDADPLEPRLPHRHAYLQLRLLLSLSFFLSFFLSVVVYLLRRGCAS
jgi:hypothetical protein